jgi:pyruvate ferredoxin oxidoreductase gamma subunit/2-oxoisovalerate ferredoxin oxidoreductase gamma subunit
MIGAFARMLGMPPLEAIAEAVKEDLAAEAQRNIDAARDAYGGVCLPGGTG